MSSKNGSNGSNGNGTGAREKYDLSPTSGKVWRRHREEGYVITLPSGNRATLRPVSLDQLLMTGGIPDLLSPVASRSLWAETNVEDIANQSDLSKQYLELINLIVPLAMVNPKIVEDPREEDEISLSDVDFMDKLAIFNLVTQPADLMRTFRDEQVRSMASAPNGENLRSEAEHAA